TAHAGCDPRADGVSVARQRAADPERDRARGLARDTRPGDHRRGPAGRDPRRHRTGSASHGVRDGPAVPSGEGCRDRGIRAHVPGIAAGAARWEHLAGGARGADRPQDHPSTPQEARPARAQRRCDRDLGELTEPPVDDGAGQRCWPAPFSRPSPNAARISRVAAPGSGAAMTAPTTATPAAPVPRSRWALLPSMPPMPTTGMDTAAATAATPSGPIRSSPTSLVLVPNTAPQPM